MLYATEIRAQNPLEFPSSQQSRTQLEARRETNCNIIYLGIVGALETSNNKRSGVVQIGETLSGPAYSDVCARTFSPYVWPSGLHWVLKHFPAHPGPLTEEELRRAPKVILVGHSMGGWGVLSVARNLGYKNIPVELVLQVDGVGITNRTVPANVKATANFHARDILVALVRSKIKIADPHQTRLIDNVLVKDAGHESITRDPRIRELVMTTIESIRTVTAATGGQTPSVQP